MSMFLLHKVHNEHHLDHHDLNEFCKGITIIDYKKTHQLQVCTFSQRIFWLILVHVTLNVLQVMFAHGYNYIMA